MNETWWVDPADLDESQLKVLAEGPDSSLLIIGPPGSGKTNILILRANYVRSVAPRMLFLTFTRTLTEFLRAGPNVVRADQLQPNEIMTFMGWGIRTIKEHGGDYEPDGDFDAQREAVIEELNRLLDGNKIGELYDVVFVDEVQDLRADELAIIQRVTDRINAAGDARQRIYEHREGLPTIEGMVDKVLELDTHYRVGRKICAFADKILPPPPGGQTLEEGSNYDEDQRESSVDVVPSANLNAQYAACIERIKVQRRYITDEPIGVICHTRAMRDGFWEAISSDEDLSPISIIQKEDAYQPFGPNSLIRVMTVNSAKGSEFRAVHLLGAEKFRTGMRELAFTAVTRAKTELVLYHVKPLPGHMTPKSNTLPPLGSIF
ncbi:MULTISPECIES: UvrD-helicase domain-containing protein [unclassified Brevundimonas]|uniref:UvrD-helicase domain-containing protein n=1 Tax=unclassified Brevundimonas TaxID=2622653 RepID=UPI0025C03D1D|nr:MULTISPECIES: UvrD-helicase domain-containing protein [unclassified Brevundimonas]